MTPQNGPSVDQDRNALAWAIVVADRRVDEHERSNDTERALIFREHAHALRRLYAKASRVR